MAANLDPEEEMEGLFREEDEEGEEQGAQTQTLTQEGDVELIFCHNQGCGASPFFETSSPVTFWLLSSEFRALNRRSRIGLRLPTKNRKVLTYSYN